MIICFLLADIVRSSTNNILYQVLKMPVYRGLLYTKLRPRLAVTFGQTPKARWKALVAFGKAQPDPGTSVETLHAPSKNPGRQHAYHTTMSEHNSRLTSQLAPNSTSQREKQEREGGRGGRLQHEDVPWARRQLVVMVFTPPIGTNSHAHPRGGGRAASTCCPTLQRPLCCRLSHAPVGISPALDGTTWSC